MGQMGEDIADWKYFLSIISKCTDDYLYIYDLSDDYAIYSSSITKDFELDVAEFSNAGRKLKDVIYPDDYEAVFNNISKRLMRNMALRQAMRCLQYWQAFLSDNPKNRHFLYIGQEETSS